MGNLKMKIEKRVGKRTYEFVVEGSNLHEAVMESKKLSFYDVYKCGICSSDDLELDAHVAQKKFKYTTLKCNSCKASVNFGQQQENPDIFYLRTRNKFDGSGKEMEWNAAPTQNQTQQQNGQNFNQQPPQYGNNFNQNNQY